MTDEKEKRLGEFNDYEGMLHLLRRRTAELQIAVSGADTAAVSGLPDKYLQKILSIQKTRRIGMSSLGGVLGILGMKLVAFEDPIALRRFTSRLHKRDSKLVRDGAVHFSITRRFLKKIGVDGGKNSRTKMSEERATELGKIGASARWRGHKARRSAKSIRRARGQRNV